MTLSEYVSEQDGILLGSSSALNVAGALFAAARMGPNHTIVTFCCDLAERSYDKLFNPKFLQDKGIVQNIESLACLFKRYQDIPEQEIIKI